MMCTTSVDVQPSMESTGARKSASLLEGDRPPYFSRAEFDLRLEAMRNRMREHGLSVCVLSSPENIFYLTGLDHWGYFTPHMLIVPEVGELVLVTRAMERVTVAGHVLNARFEGHSDSETAADVAARVLADLAPSARRIGLEMWTAGLP